MTFWLLLAVGLLAMGLTAWAAATLGNPAPRSQRGGRHRRRRGGRKALT